MTQVEGNNDTTVLTPSGEEVIQVPTIKVKTKIDAKKAVEQFEGHLPIVWFSDITNIDGFFNGNKDLKSIAGIKSKSVLSAASLFANCTNLVTLPKEIQLPRCNILDYMFDTCIRLKSASSFLLPNAVSLRGMFRDCTGLENIEGIITTNKLNDTVQMFKNCRKLETVPLFNTSHVTNTREMFMGCSNLIKYPEFDLYNDRILSDMFNSCSSLSEINLGEMYEPKVMDAIFAGCTSLRKVYPIDTKTVFSMQDMFMNCKNLEEVPELDFRLIKYMNYQSIMSHMLEGCKNLSKLADMIAGKNKDKLMKKNRRMFFFSQVNYINYKMKKSLSRFKNFGAEDILLNSVNKVNTDIQNSTPPVDEVDTEGNPIDNRNYNTQINNTEINNQSPVRMNFSNPFIGIRK